MKRNKKILAYFLSLALMMTSLPTQIFAATSNNNLDSTLISGLQPQLTTPSAIKLENNKYVGEGYTIEFKVSNQWPGAFGSEMVITNTGEEALENWELSFDFDYEINNMWNGQIITHKDHSYTIKNMGWNQDIAPGSSIAIGFQANGEGSIVAPSQYKLTMEKQIASEAAYAIAFKITSNWGSGFNGEISITNKSEVPIEDWSLAFDFEGKISNFWTAKILEHKGNHYLIKNAGYNANIAPGQTLTLGFVGSDLQNTSIRPDPYELSYIGMAKEKEDIDYEIDTDQDDLPDYYEKALGTDPLNADSDGDTLPDGYEYWELMTDPLLGDSDHNAINDAQEDFDQDGLSNIQEFLLQTDTYNKDTDEDGLVDGDEVNKYSTNPLVADLIDYELDTDHDGLADGLEMRTGTELNNADTDADALPDGYEVLTLSTNPLERDSDHNGINDSEEDADEDSLNHLEEYKLGTDPFKEDSDKDGLKDGEEVYKYSTNSMLYDTDGDEIGDGDEIKLGLNPLSTSTHGVLDNEYMIEQSVSEEALKYVNTEENDYNLSIDVTASGNAEDNVIVSTSQYANSLASNDAIVGKTISIDYYGGKIETGKLSFKVDDSVIEQATQNGLTNSEAQGLKKFYVFNFNEELNMLVPVPTSYDEANETLVSDLIGNGTYCLMNVEKWLVNVGAMDDTTTNSEVTNKIATNSLVNNYSANNLLAASMLSSSTVTSPIAADRSNVMPLSKARQKKVDLVLVVETDYTMESKLSSVKAGLKDIVNTLKNENLDVEVSIIDVKDVNQMKTPNAILINGTPAPKAEKSRALSFTNDTEEIENYIDALDAYGGYDYFTAGTQLAGVAYGGALPFREGASKFILLVTDKNTGIKNYHGYTTTGPLFHDLKAKNISFSVSTMNKDLGGTIPDMTVQNYKRCINRGVGIFFSLRNFRSNVSEYTDFVTTHLIGEKEFTILKSTSLEKVELKSPLAKGGSTNSDEDTLTDSQEVDWDKIKFENGELKLPTFGNLWQWPGAVYDIEKIENMPWFATCQDQIVLPITSDPTMKDSDDDGLVDHEDDLPLKNTFKPIWIKQSIGERNVYIAQIKFGEENTRVIDFDNKCVYSWHDNDWVKVDEKIPNLDIKGSSNFGEDGLVIEHPDQNAIIDMNNAFNISHGVESQLQGVQPEDIELVHLGIAMGHIDAFFPENDEKIQVLDLLAVLNPNSKKSDYVKKVGTMPGRERVNKFVLKYLTDKTDEELEQNEVYLTSKSLTEFYMMVQAIKIGGDLIVAGLGLFTDGVARIGEGGTLAFAVPEVGAKLIGAGQVLVGGAEVAAGTASGVMGVMFAAKIAPQAGKACYDDWKKLEGAGKSVEWTNHGYKHFPQKNMSWKDIVKSTKSGPAKYSPDVNIESLERMVWEKGTPVTNGKTWKVMEFDEVIGASMGMETKYVRVEMSSGVIHGHPITVTEYNKLLK